MKKFLEVLIDDNGDFHFSSEMELLDGELSDRKAQEMEKTQKKLIKEFTEFVWKNRKIKPGKAIRMLSIAEIMSKAQPYEAIEEFWSKMILDDFIKNNEKWVEEIKRKHGFDGEGVVRPIVRGGINMFPMPFPSFPPSKNLS